MHEHALHVYRIKLKATHCNTTNILLIDNPLVDPKFPLAIVKGCKL